MNRRFQSLLISLLFGVSGGIALLHEVIWLKALGTCFGVTTLAVSAVLTAMMLGLALGGIVGGHAARRSANPLRLFALLEAGIGGYALATPALLQLASDIYTGSAIHFLAGAGLLTALRFTLAVIVLFPPAFLMGATLPAIVQAYPGSSSDRPALATALLYGLNTVGAVCGTLAATFLVLPGLGITRSLQAGAAGNLLVAAMILLIARFADGNASAPPPAVRAGRETALRISVTTQLAVFLAGVSMLILEIAWTRLLTPVSGSTVHAFSLMLAAYLLGHGLGSLLGFPLISTRLTTGYLLPLLLAGGGLSAALGLLLFPHLPAWLAALHPWYSEQPAVFFLLLGGFCLLVMLPVTACAGAVIPAALHRERIPPILSGEAVGLIAGRNTTGSLIGSLTAALLVIPLLGLRGSVFLAAGLLMLAALLLLDRQRNPSGFRITLMTAMAFSAASLFSGPSAETAIALDQLTNRRAQALAARGEERLFLNEGHNATVAVWNRSGHRTLEINGRPNASDWPGDMLTQRLLAHLPMLHAPRAREAFVVGLGSGVTLASLARYPLTTIRCAELEPAVREAAELFRHVTDDALDDPRVEIMERDARDLLQTRPDLYDVIISEPSHLWIAGMANLFTLDFYRLCRQRMRPHAVFCQWVHIYQLDAEDLRTVLHTFRTAFPHVSIWFARPGDLLLLGSGTELSLSWSELLRLEPVWRLNELAEQGMDSPAAFISGFLLSGTDLENWLGNGSILQTVDRPVLEYTVPLRMLANTTLEHFFALLAARKTDLPQIHGRPVEFTATEEVSLARALLARSVVTLAQKHLTAALEKEPDHAGARQLQTGILERRKKGGRE